jgi:modulator of FtsH protease HflK
MKEQNRGKNVALAGAVLQTAFTATLVVVYLITGSRAALSTAWMIGWGIPLWLMVANLFYCRKLAAQEEIELEEITQRGGQAGGIFQEGVDTEMRPAAARVQFMERWVVPIFSIAFAACNAGVGLWLVTFGGLPAESIELRNIAQGILGAIVPGFVAFLFSYYAMGMSKEAGWRPLRSAGSFLFVGVLPMAAVAVGLLASSQSYHDVDLVIAYVIPFFQLVLAAEILINLLLDLYRPRVPGQERRFAFDSRLFHLVAAPGRVGHSIAETLNYQFGFEVSKTWFYQLLGKAMVPMIAFGVLAMLTISSFVIVEEGEQAVVKHWGRIDPDRPVLDAGLHMKWPWPIDRVDHFRVGEIHEVRLGVGEKRGSEERESEIIRAGTFAGRELYLWSKTHGRREELDFLIAVAPDTRQEGTLDRQPPPVSVIKLVVVVQYKIDDVMKFAYRFVDAPKLLEQVAYREMIRYCATATLDTRISGEAGIRPEAIMTFGRESAARELHKRIARAVGRQGLDMGVDIIYVGVEGAHPPAEAAEAFEEVIQAERQRDGTVYLAEAWANRTLANVAGEPDFALELSQMIRRLREIEDLYQLRGNSEDFQRTLASYIRLAEKDVGTLDEEIERERLGGEEQRERFKQHLRAMIQERHLNQTLLKIKADPDGYPYEKEIAAARLATDAKLADASGSAATLLARAKSYRWQKEMGERGRSGAFERQLLAYNASPNVFKLFSYLDVLDEVLPDIPKYILAVPREKVEVRLDFRSTGGGLSEVPFTSEGQGG